MCLGVIYSTKATLLCNPWFTCLLFVYLNSAPPPEGMKVTSTLSQCGKCFGKVKHEKSVYCFNNAFNIVNTLSTSGNNDLRDVFILVLAH